MTCYPYFVFLQDGHVVCYMCYALPEMKVGIITDHEMFHKTLTITHQECPECSGPIIGRNLLVESIAAVVFSRELSMSNRWEKVKHSWYEVVAIGGNTVE